MPQSLPDYRRILVIATRQIGDVLLTTPLIAQARSLWPNAQIDVLGFTGTLGMLEGHPQVGRLIEVKPGSGWLQSLSLIRSLWRRYDLALVTQRSDRAHLYAWVAARVRSGLMPGEASLSWWKRRLLDHPLVVNGEDTHVVVEKLRLLDPWRVGTAARVEVIAPPSASLPAQLRTQLRAPMCVVHVPSMWRYKQWPIASYRELIAALVADGVQVVLTGGKGANDRTLVDQVLDVAKAPDLIDACGTLSLPQVSALLRQSALYVGPDTSITHLAAACGTPVIALFGPITPQLWGPWPQGGAEHQPWQRRGWTQRSERVILMQGPGECVPCNREGCERHLNSRSDCLEHIEVKRVLEEVRSVLRA
jgi:heptosyltransferase-3